MIIKNQIKELIKNEGLSTSTDVYDKLEKEVTTLIKKACERAKANNRKTCFERDF